MNWSPTAYVYGLRFKGSDIFYVGSTRNMTSRMKAHMSYKADAKYPYQLHILEGLRRGDALEMIELEVSNVNDVKEREAFWIWTYSNQVFNRMMPGWAALSCAEGDEIKELNATINRCKERISELVRQGRERSCETNRKLRFAAKSRSNHHDRQAHPYAFALGSAGAGNRK